MNELNKTKDDVVGELLARLGRELTEPLRALIAEIHALDARNAEDDAAARLVELGYDLQTILEPVTALAQFEAAPASTDKTDIDLNSLLEETVATPELAASFKIAVRGELGVSFDDNARLEQGLSLCLRLMSRMTKDKTRLQVHREVHEPIDRIVVSVQIREPRPLALELLKRAAHLLGASVDVDGSALLFGFPVAERPEREKASPTSPEPSGPVLAFRRDQRRGSSELEVSERASIVLVVDHEPAAQDYMSRILELEGFDVVKSSTLEDAYAAAHAYNPDVIIVDRLQLAREDGEWVRRFKADPALARIPLVLVQSEESESLGLVGVSDVVRKPINPDEVVATVDRLTGASSSPLLLVRDQEDASEWERCLEDETRRVVTASSASEAERVLDTVTPAALIVDIRNMNMNGTLSLLEDLRRSDRTRDVPVVAIHGRLTEKARLHLESLADRRLTFSELSRSSLQVMLRELTGDAEQSGLGVS